MMIAVDTVLYYATRLALTAFLRIWFDVSIEDVDRIPAEGPVVIVSNHRSWQDIALICLLTSGVLRFLVAAELSNKSGVHKRAWLRASPLPFKTFARLAGWFSGKLGAWRLVHTLTIPIDKRKRLVERETLRRGLGALADRGILAIFNKGVRNNGDELSPFKPLAPHLAEHSGAQAIPVGIHGSEQHGHGASIVFKVGAPLRVANFRESAKERLSGLNTALEEQVASLSAYRPPSR